MEDGNGKGFSDEMEVIVEKYEEEDKNTWRFVV